MDVYFRMTDDKDFLLVARGLEVLPRVGDRFELGDYRCVADRSELAYSLVLNPRRSGSKTQTGQGSTTGHIWFSLVPVL